MAALFSISFLFIEVTRFSLFLSLSAVAQIYPPTEYYTQTVVYQDCCIISPNGPLCMRGCCCCCCYFLLQVLLRHNGICFQINETPFFKFFYSLCWHTRRKSTGATTADDKTTHLRPQRTFIIQRRHIYRAVVASSTEKNRTTPSLAAAI